MVDPSGQTARQAGPIRVLVVEDEALVAMFLETLLDDLGHVVVATVGTGDAALSAAAEHGCDIALVDIGLQGARDGIETAALLRDRFALPAIFMSGAAEAVLMERAEAIGALGFVSKPYTSGDVEAVLNAAIPKLRSGAPAPSSPREEN